MYIHACIHLCVFTNNATMYIRQFATVDSTVFICLGGPIYIIVHMYNYTYIVHLHTIWQISMCTCVLGFGMSK